MKARKVLIAAALAALAILSAGCKKHNPWRPVAGTQIQFSARSNMTSDGQTKTVYNNNNGEYFIVGEGENARKYEAIDWEEGDNMSVGYVYVKDGSVDAQYWKYFVDPATITSGSSNNGVSKTRIQPDGGNGLKWQDADVHMFYATSPAISDADIESGEFYFRGNDNHDNITSRVPYYYPGTLDASSTDDMTRDGRTFVENMKYAYLNSFDGASVTTDASGNVTLLLAPHFMAFEISACAAGEAEIPLKGFRLSCESAPITGTFYLEYLLDEEDGQYYWENIPKEGDYSNTISVDFSNISGGITLKPDDPLTFTFFTRGGWWISRVTITFFIEKSNGTIVNRSLKLQENGGWIGFTGNRKHRIFGLKVPIEPSGLWFEGTDAGSYNQEDWEL